MLVKDKSKTILEINKNQESSLDTLLFMFIAVNNLIYFSLQFKIPPINGR
jgi:hypothetical protein